MGCSVSITLESGDGLASLPSEDSSAKFSAHQNSFANFSKSGNDLKSGSGAFKIAARCRPSSSKLSNKGSDASGHTGTSRNVENPLDRLNDNEASGEEPVAFKIVQLGEEYSKFLVTYTSALLDRSESCRESSDGISKPTLEIRSFKPHTMDNVRVRSMCDELIHLQDPSYPLKDGAAAPSKRAPQALWLPTLRVSTGGSVHGIELRSQPNISIGGYFLLSQTLGCVRSLFSLDLSSNGLGAAEARVLSLGLSMNRSLVELRLKGNAIACDGATNLAESFSRNSTLLLLDLRENGIRGGGVCALTDALSRNAALTQLDVRWNYVRESADYVERAVVDMRGLCRRNRRAALLRALPPAADPPPVSRRLEPGSWREGGAGALPPPRPVLPRRSSVRSVAASGVEGSLGRFSSAGDATGSAMTGRIQVTVLWARNLPSAAGLDSEGEGWALPHAYCACAVTDAAVFTRVAARGFGPEWHDAFDLPVAAAWNVVGVRVRHADRGGQPRPDDATLGRVCVPVGAVANWRGVTSGLNGTFKAVYRPMVGERDPLRVAPKGFYQCSVRDPSTGAVADTFATPAEAARAYDETAQRIDGEEALLNFTTHRRGYVGQDMKEEDYPLVGEDGIRVLGVQPGVFSELALRLKYFAPQTDYIEIHLDRATCLPRMDSGLGTCDAYIRLLIGEYHFRSRVVRNSLDPEFKQSFRISGAPRGAPAQQLVLQLFDWDRFDADDHMGNSIIELDVDLLSRHQLDRSFFVTKVAKGEAGVEELITNAHGERSAIHLRFEYFPYFSSDAGSSSDEEYEEEGLDNQKSSLTENAVSEIPDDKAEEI